MRKRIERTLLIDTDAYAGNFDRQMFAWIFGIGATDEEPSYIDELCEVAVRDLGPDGGRLCGFLETRPREHDGNYHPSFIDIYPTPGFWHDGEGNHFPNRTKPGKGQTTFPAYQTLGVFVKFKYVFPVDLLRIVKKRARMFAKLNWSDRHMWVDPFKIRGFRLITTTSNTATYKI